MYLIHRSILFAFIVFTSFSSFAMSDSSADIASSAVTNILINDKFESLLEESNGLFSGGETYFKARGEEKGAYAIELSSHFVFVRRTSRDTFGLFSLNKQTKEITSLLTGQPTRTKVRRVNDNQVSFFVSPTMEFPRGKIFTSNGTPEGTIPLNVPFLLADENNDFWLDNHTLYVAGASRFYKVDLTTQEEVELVNIHTRQLVLQSDSFSFFKGTQTADSILVNHKSNSVTRFAPSSEDIISPDWRTIRSLDGGKVIYFFNKVEDDVVLGKVSADLGYTELFNINDMPSCQDTVTNINLRYRVIEDKSYVYFVGETNSRNCIYRYNKESKVFNTLNSKNTDNFSQLTSIELLKVSGGKLLAKAQEYIGLSSKVGNMFILDFEAGTTEDVLPSVEFDVNRNSDNRGDIELYNFNDNFAFGYITRVCSFEYKCENNVFFKIDLNTFEYTSFGNRVGVSEQFEVVTEFDTGFVLDEELYMFADLPQGGLYRTNTTAKNIELFDPLWLGNDALPAEFELIEEYENGWFVLTSDPLALFHIDLNLEKTELSLPSSFDPLYHFDYVLSLSESGDYAFIYNTRVRSTIISVDLRNFATKTLYQQSNNADGNVVGIINDTAYIYSTTTDQPKLILLDLIQEVETLETTSPVEHFFQCADKVFSIASVYVNEYDALLNSPDLYVLEDAIQKIDLPIDNNRRGFRVDSKETGKILLGNFEHLGIFDCDTMEYTPLLEPTEDSSYLAISSIHYNYFNHSYYFGYAGAIWQLDMTTGSFTEIIEIPGPSSDLSFNPSDLEFTENGIFFVGTSRTSDILIDSIYRIENGEAIAVFQLTERLSGVTDDVERTSFEHNLRFTQHSASSDRRYLFGTYFSQGLFKGRSFRSVTTTRNQPFVFDSLRNELHLIDLSKGAVNELQSVNIFDSLSLNQGFLAFIGSNLRMNEGITIINLECYLEQVCGATAANQAPIISDGIKLYYQLGHRVDLYARALDIDSENLTYSLVNAPSWLSVDTQGFITGVVPDNADLVYSDIRVSVSDTEQTTISTPYELVITNASLSTPPLIELPPVVEADEPSDGSSGGAVGSIHLLFLLCMLGLRNRRCLKHP